MSARRTHRGSRLTERLVGQKILLVEDSRVYSIALQERFERLYGTEVTHCADLGALETALAEDPTRFGLAMVDLNLAGAPSGEALDLLLAKEVPPIVFTATFSEIVRHAVLAKPVADYVLKDGPAAVDNVIASAVRLLSNRHVRVLVVDDVRSTRQLMVRHLETQLFPVATATSGPEALTMLDRHPDIGLAVIDFEMPEMNGVELVKEIRSDIGFDRVRIIGVSSGSSHELMTKFLKAGANDFIQRPFDIEEFHWRMAQNVNTVLQLREMREQAARDYLTGLFNRRHFFEEGPREVHAARSCTEPVPMSMAVLDIDHFKRLNDTYGHEVGDEVLKAISERLNACCGKRHIVARLGGEEFGILIRGLDLADAKIFCDALRSSIGSQPVPTTDGDLSVTVSIGLAEIADIETFDNYLNAADQFLYMAKHAGRDCVISEQDLGGRAVA